MANESQTQKPRRDRLKHWLPSGFDPYAPSGTYIPNKVSSSQRIAYAVWAFALVAYGTIGIALDDIFIPGRRGSGVHFHGSSAWLMYGAIVLGSTIFIAEVIDHYDTRNNERWYQIYRKTAKAASVALIVCAAVNSIVPLI